jgi:hypothetical protein
MVMDIQNEDHQIGGSVIMKPLTVNKMLSAESNRSKSHLKLGDG